MEQALVGLSSDEVEQYHDLRAQWKQLRDGVDTTMAARVAAKCGQGAKQWAVLGDGHFNATGDVDDILREKGLKVATIQIYPNLTRYGEYLVEYIDQVPKDGKPRQLPDYVYFADSKQIGIPRDNETLNATARAAYDAMRRKENTPTLTAAPAMSETVVERQRHEVRGR